MSRVGGNVLGMAKQWQGGFGVAKGNGGLGGMIEDEVRGKAGARITLSHRGWILFCERWNAFEGHEGRAEMIWPPC